MFGLNKYIIVGLIVTLGLMGTAIKYYMSKSEHYQKEAIQNEMAYESSSAALKYYANMINKRTGEIDTLNSEFAKIEDKSDEAKNIFRRHNFSKLVEEKPDTIERLINTSTARMLEDFRSIFDDDPSDSSPESSETE